MSENNWCHNPDCHKIETNSRIRGTGDNKVLRTRKIKVYNSNDPHVYDFFCNQNCLHSFLRQFIREVANIRPVKQPSETPIKVELKTYDAPEHSYYNGRKYKTIKVLNE